MQDQTVSGDLDVKLAGVTFEILRPLPHCKPPGLRTIGSLISSAVPEICEGYSAWLHSLQLCMHGGLVKGNSSFVFDSVAIGANHLELLHDLGDGS